MSVISGYIALMLVVYRLTRGLFLLLLPPSEITTVSTVVRSVVIYFFS
jgi:hypothetical protein